MSKPKLENAAPAATPHGNTPATSIAAQTRKSRKADAAARTNVHATRIQDAQTHHAVHSAAEEPWAPPDNLPQIPARDGMVQRYIRVAMLKNGEPDPKNVARKMQEGWRARLANTAPEGFVPPTIASGQFAGAIGVADMILMEMPKSRADERAKHYASKTARQMEGVDNDLNRVEQPGMPITRVRKSSISNRDPTVKVAQND